MAKVISKVINKYRVTLQEQKIASVDSTGNYIKDGKGGYVYEYGIPLGFANAYEPNTKAYAKREETQDRWAYGSMCKVVNDEYFTVSYENIYDSNGKYTHRITQEVAVPRELQPIIIDNIPLDGFRVQKSVSRYSTSNKVWRILDPRGFELEITTDTMETLIADGVIDHGEIIGKCYWKTAKMLVRA